MKISTKTSKRNIDLTDSTRSDREESIQSGCNEIIGECSCEHFCFARLYLEKSFGHAHEDFHRDIEEEHRFDDIVFKMARFLPLLPIVAVAAEKGDSLGQKLGRAVVSSVQDIQKEGGDYESTIMDLLASKQEVLSSPEISKPIAAANSLAEQKGPTDPTCERDLSAACPDGWEASEGGCSAPASYAGGCAAFQAFGAATTQQAKLEFAATCGAPWPCAGGCANGADYEACPLGWQAMGGGYCSSQASTKCGSLFNFAAMDVAQKQELAKDCGLKWACKG